MADKVEQRIYPSLKPDPVFEVSSYQLEKSFTGRKTKFKLKRNKLTHKINNNYCTNTVSPPE